MTFHHKNIRLDRDQYVGPRAYFITACCRGRSPVFHHLSRGHWALDNLCRLLPAQAMDLHAYCIMPDHAHFLLQGKSPASNLLRLVKDFKQMTAFHYKRETGQPLWQKKVHDHILRDGESLDAVAWYIWLNPVRKGICTRPEDYPLSGSLTLPWPRNALPAELWTPYWKQKPTAPT